MRLSQAELLLQAKNYSGSGDWLDEVNSHDAALSGPLFKPWDGETYAYLPGTSGNYMDTADTNLLDADWAHAAQSHGGWLENAQAIITATPQSPPVAPPFGTTAVEITVRATAGESSIYNGVPASTTGFAVSGSTEYTASLYIYTDIAARLAFVRMLDYDSSDVVGDTTTGPTTALTVGAWTQIEVTHTTAADAAGAALLVQFDATGDVTGGDVWYQAAHCVQAGSDGTFTPSLRIVGDLDLRAKAGNDDWTNGFQCLLDAQDGTSGYYLAVDTAGELRTTHGTGADARINTSSGAALVNGSAYELRFTYDLASGTVTYYKDGTSFGTASDTTTAAAAAGVALGVGSLNLGLAWFYAGDIYWAEVRDGIDGPVVARFDAEDAAEPFATQVGDTDGRTWTYNRSASGLVSTVVDRDMFLLSTDDYLDVTDHADLDFADGEDMTLIVAARRMFAPPAWSRLITKRAGVDTGYELLFTGDGVTCYAEFEDSTTATNNDSHGTTTVSGELYTYGVRRTEADNEWEVFVNGTGSGSPGVLATADGSNGETLRIGATSAPGDYYEGQIIAVALFREALTDLQYMLVHNALAGIVPGEGAYDGMSATQALEARLTAESLDTGGSVTTKVATLLGSTIDAELLGHLRTTASATGREELEALRELIVAAGASISGVGEVEAALVRFAEVYDNT